MRAIIHVARLHLMLILQDRVTYIQSFAVPAILMVVLSLALSEDNFAFDLTIDVVDQDQSALSAEFIELLQAPSQAGSEPLVICRYGAENNPETCNLDADDRFEEVGETRLQDQAVFATLVISSGFGESLTNGQPTALEYRSDEQLNTQTLARTAINARVAQFSSSLSIATVGIQTSEEFFAHYPDASTRQTAFESLRGTAQTALASPPTSVNKVSAGEEEVIVGLGARQSVSGMGCMFVLFSLLSLAQFMMEERTQGTLQRLFTLPTPKVTIVMGKILGTFLFGCFQFTIFVIVGAIMGVEWGSNYPAIALVIAAYCFAGTALGFMLSTFVKTTAQAANIITFGGLVLAPLGGAWWPLTIVPDFMRMIGYISPISWAMEGFQELLYYNGNVLDVLPMCAALVGYAALYITIAVWKFRYE